MDRITCMQAFIAVASESSFSAAGRTLGISKVLVSKYVNQLEDQLGARLLHRTTRKVSLTTTGSAFLEPCKNLLEEFEQLQGAVQDVHRKPQGRLRLTAPTTFAEMHLLNIIEQFHADYPDVQIELELTDRYVDLVEEGFDLGIRIGRLEDSSLIAKPIAKMRSFLCASPEYLARAGRPEEITQLNDFDLIADSNYRSGKHWEFQHQQLGNKVVSIDPLLKINSARAVRDLLISGKGIGICPEFAVYSDLLENKLEILFEDWYMPEQSMYAIYPHRRHLSAKVRLFIEALTSANLFSR